MKTKLNWILMTALFFINISQANSQNISMAKDLYEHNLTNRALEEFILIYNTENISPQDRSEALYYMGQISFDKNQYSMALNDWKKLIKTFPNSKRAIAIKDNLTELNEVLSKSTDEKIASSIAQSYISNGDFWSNSDRIFMIDASWLPRVELAINWYDKVIADFPNTYAADLAYNRKLFAILGWSNSGGYYGIIKDYKKYMPLLLKTFNEYEAAFPESSSLQGFRYQIAQAYWNKKDWDNTRVWLNKIIEKSNGKPSFYSETAKARLNKLKY